MSKKRVGIIAVIILGLVVLGFAGYKIWDMNQTPTIGVVE